MRHFFGSSLVPAVAVAATAFAGSALAQVELTTNGDFETGDLTGWTQGPPFITGTATWGVTSDSSSGDWAGVISNNVNPSGQVAKQANIGIGIVTPGETLDISFDLKGNFADGGVGIVEFFSELSGGGVSSSQILGGGPLFFATQTAYQTFNFQVVTGPDVSGGVTLQFVAATGAASSSLAELFIDNVSVRTIPEPASALLGLGAVGLMLRRRAA